MDNTIIMEASKVLFYEPILGTYFYSTITDISKALCTLHLLRRGNIDAIVSINDWYGLLGIPAREIGDYVGWNSFLMWGEITIEYQYGIAKNDEPSIRLEYNLYPMWISSETFNKPYRNESQK